MLKRRISCFLLTLALLVGAFPPVAMAADNDAYKPAITKQIRDGADDGIVTSLHQVYSNTAFTRHLNYLVARYPLTYATGGYAFDAAGGRLPALDATAGSGAEWSENESADGALYLGGGPGGAGVGRTRYLRFPTGMLDGATLPNEDTLTISFWSKRMAPAGMANAFFLGTAPGEGGVPATVPNNYVVVNPAKLYNAGAGGAFHSGTRYFYTLAARMTNTAAAVGSGLTSPWTREIGFQGEAGARRYTQRWTHYAVVLTPTAFEFFVDGRQIGTTLRDEPLVRNPGNLLNAYIERAFAPMTQAKQSTLSDYGTGLEILLGMSNYVNDPSFHGYFGDVEFYSAAFNAFDMRLLYEAQRDRFFSAPEPAEGGPFLMSYTLPLGSSSGSGWTGANYGVAAANVYHYMGIYDNSLHIAYSMDGVEWTPLNDNRGILYRRMNAAWTGDATGTWSEYTDPFIYQLQCGTFVMVATALNREQVLASGNIMVSASTDLLNWSLLRILPTNGTAVANRPRQPRISQAADGTVHVYWVRNTSTTDRYQVAETTAANLISGNATLVGTAATDGGAAWRNAFNSADVDTTRAPAGALIGNAVNITNANLEALRDRWATPEFDSFTIVTTAGADSSFDDVDGLPTYGTISLTDGTQYFYGTGRDRDLAYEEPGSRWVDWVRTADVNTPGVYEVEGFIRYDIWNPLNLNGADPAITKCHMTGRFFHIASDKDLVNPGRGNYQYRRIWLTGPAYTIGELRSMADEVAFSTRIDEQGRTRPVRGDRLPLRPPSGVTWETGPNQADHPFKRVVYDPIWGNNPFDVGPAPGTGGPTGAGMDDPNVNLWAPEMRWVEFGDCDCRALDICGYHDCEGNTPSVSCRHKTADPVQCAHDGRWVIHHGGAPNRTSQWSIRMWTMYNRNINPMEGEWSRPRYLADGDGNTFNLDANTFEHRGDWWIMHVSTYGVPSSPRTARMHNFQTMYGHDGNPLHPLPGGPAGVPGGLQDTRERGHLQFPVMPVYNWEQRANRVLEGTTMLWANGRLWLNYAAASTDASYVIGFAYTDVNTIDLADGANWGRIGHPIMQLSPDTSQYGPGHSMFVESETITAPNGRQYSFPVLSYHARQTNMFRNDPLQEPTRFQRIAPVYFHRDGTPYLGQPANDGWAPGLPLRGTVIVAASEGERQMLEGLHSFDLHRPDDVRGNITLPRSSDGTNLSWQSSHPDVVSPSGIVTRPDHGEDNLTVTLTVTGTRSGYTAEREIEVVVKPEPPNAPLTRAVRVHAEEVTFEARAGYTGYRSHAREAGTRSIGFMSTSGATADEWNPLMSRNFYAVQCSFGFAGTEYHAFTESIGSGNMISPFITSSPYGDMFYVIGSDGTPGNLAVWESRDLFTFADQRLVTIPGAGIIEVPNVVWDETSGSYTVRWMSGDDRFSSNTRDFVAFTAAAPYAGTWVTEEYSTVQLTTAQFGKVVGVDAIGRSASLASLTIAGENVDLSINPMRIAVEATTITASDVAYVLMDHTATATVTVAEDNGSYTVTIEVSSAYRTRTYTVHVDRIRLPQTPIAHYDFEGDANNRIPNSTFGAMTLLAATGANAATHRAFIENHGAASPANGESGSYLRLQNNTTLASHGAGRARFPDGLFDGREQVTLAMDVYTTLNTGYFFTFALQPVGSTTFNATTGRYFLNRVRGGEMRNAITVSGWGANESGINTPGWGINTWSRLVLVFDGTTMAVYLNGELVGQHNDMNSSIAGLDSADEGLWAYLGRAPMAGDRAFAGGFDNIKVWDYALSSGEVLGEFRANATP
ncbi:MAG: family 43 glycosylhydrolase [Oscillospiraceae bacterium]|nr:family 43 glycosylhydrolase [Oscillospiraceae bacterium]